MSTFYYVRWFTRYGTNYKDTSMVPYCALKKMRALAKKLGETIKVEKMEL